MGRGLVEALLDLRIGDHVCYIYETPEQMDAIAPYIMQGTQRNEQCLYIADENSGAEVTNALEGRGLNVSAAISRGQLNIITKTASYVKEGYFDPDKMIVLLRESTEAVLASGYQALRATGEMTWSLAGHPGSERLLEYEVKLNHFLPHHRALAVCQYNAKKFSPEILLEIIKTHPLVIYGDHVCRNFYYIPPDEFLQEKKEAEKELRRCLRYMEEREELDRKLTAYATQLEQKIKELNALNAMFQQFLAQHFELQEAYKGVRSAIDQLVAMTETGKEETGNAPMPSKGGELR